MSNAARKLKRNRPKPKAPRVMSLAEKAKKVLGI